MSSTAFHQEFEPLSAARPEFGRVALVPWDSETFGIRIADLEIGTDSECPSALDLSRALRDWSRGHGVQLIGASVPTAAVAHIDALQAAGFRYLDTTLRVTYQDLQSTALPASLVELRPGRASDVHRVLAIAGCAFTHGRYHADRHLDSERANQRYRDWVTRAVSSAGRQELYVAAFDDDVRAFSVIEMSGTTGHLHLIGVAPQWQRPPLGATLATLRLFQSRGAVVVHSKISAANIVALNVHAHLGARFHSPAALLHWHTHVR
jgi:ribosomal protein S18 acetylase RimI-like enzyme